MRRRLILILAFVLVAVAAFAIATRGDSKEDKAKAQVCDARADIRDQVDKIQNLTAGAPTTGSLKQIGEIISKDIKKDLETIKKAQGDLDSTRKQQVEKAKAQFESDLAQITATFSKQFSAKNARAALTQLATAFSLAFQTALGPIDCN